VMKRLWAFAVLVTVSVVILIRKYRRALALTSELEKELKKEQKKRNDERTGRTTAERELRQAKVVSAEGGQTSSSCSIIGFLESVFRTRNGTPRQGNVVPTCRAKLQLLDKGKDAVCPSQCLEGLEEFSHVWIIFIFHENTNWAKSATAGTGQTKIKGKVNPPRGGKRVGLFSTRTPHRPNPFGLSTARIDKVDSAKGILHLSSIDLLHGTPVLDIKPYIPHWDGLQGASIPSWIGEACDADAPRTASFSGASLETLEQFVSSGKMQFYGKSEVEAAQTAILEVLRQDVRSPHKKKMAEGKEDVHAIFFDRIEIVFTISANGTHAQVDDLSLIEGLGGRPPQRVRCS